MSRIDPQESFIKGWAMEVPNPLLSQDQESTMSEPKTFTLGEIEVTACLFRNPKRNGTIYVITTEHMDSATFRSKYFDPTYRIEYEQLFGKPINFDDSYDTKFWLMANVDCFDPPKYVVRSKEEDAIDWFLDETDACLISEPDLADYGDPESDDCRITFDSNGRPHDTEALQMWEVKLIGIETE